MARIYFTKMGAPPRVSRCDERPDAERRTFHHFFFPRESKSADCAGEFTDDWKAYLTWHTHCSSFCRSAGRAPFVDEGFRFFGKTLVPGKKEKRVAMEALRFGCQSIIARLGSGPQIPSRPLSVADGKSRTDALVAKQIPRGVRPRHSILWRGCPPETKKEGAWQSFALRWRIKRSGIRIHGKPTPASRFATTTYFGNLHANRWRSTARGRRVAKIGRGSRFARSWRIPTPTVGRFFYKQAQNNENCFFRPEFLQPPVLSTRNAR